MSAATDSRGIFQETVASGASFAEKRSTLQN